MGTSGARTLSYYSRFRLSFHSNFKKSFRTLHISSGYDALHIRANSPFFKISEEIREALHAKRPIIALETAIYTHGFPYPDNIKLSTHLESVVRQQGGIPATIGVLDGIAHIGMIAEDLHKLTSSAGASSTIKVSRRDLSYICGLVSLFALSNSLSSSCINSGYRRAKDAWRNDSRRDRHPSLSCWH